MPWTSGPTSSGASATRVRAEGLKNVEIVHGAATDPKLPPVSLDAALIVNAYHEMHEHQAMLTALKAALKPNGRLVIVEPISESRRTNARADQTRNHEIGIDFVRQDAREAGFVGSAGSGPVHETRERPWPCQRSWR